LVVKADEVTKKDGSGLMKFTAELEGIRRRRPWTLDPGRCALMILDMQEYFLRPESHAYLPGAPVILPGLKKLQRRFLESNRPVIHTRHLNRPGRAGLMETWWRDLIRKESPLSAVTPELSDPRVKVVVKSQYDAFFRTRLESWLRQKEISQLVITGVVTHLCVETTIRSAFVRGFSCFLPVDGTATYDRSYFRGSVRNLAHGFAVPVGIEEICRRLT